jgi:cobyrinic acid a,c-diamide synthase
MIPRLVIAGAASGVGKTTVMVALTSALRARGLRVAAFKCGPDYLDPTYHARASGGVSHNLDGWMMGKEAVLATFARNAHGADLALVEGMMGLYDGAAPESDDGSAAQIARWLGAPVITVVDASAMVRTIAALGLGLREFDRSLDVAGLFANRVGSRAHLDMLVRASSAHVPVVGGLPSDPAHAFPERHLGLLAADERCDVEAWGRTFAEWNDVDALVAIARRAPDLALPTPPTEKLGRRCRIAVARDAAFHFYYEDNLARLESLGAELVPFSPLADERAPAADGVYLGGGYPEAYAAALAANRSMRASLRAQAASGTPIYAECGGLMYLANAIRTVDGSTHEMLGILHGVAVMHERLQAIGYVEVETATATLLGPAGTRMRGHQFRWSTLEGGRGDAYRDLPAYAEGNVLGSYVHVHWASNPAAAESYVTACARYRASR